MRYIGSKRTVLPFIKTTIEETYGNISNAIVADLFAGTACVGEMFKREGARVLSNDYLSFSYALQIEKIKLNGIPESKRSYLDLISLLNAAPGKEGFFFREYSIEGSSHGEYTRNYFSKDNAMKIDGVRTQIELLRVNGEISEDMYFLLIANLIDAVTRVSNTSGTYGAFLKVDDPRKDLPLSLCASSFVDNGKKNECYCKDIFELIDNLNGDILYLDPPYNGRQYPPYYHILDTVTKYDNPAIYGKTGRRPYANQISPFCVSEKAEAALFDIVKRARFGNIYICLALLRYVSILQGLVDKICGFILTQEFREILINDKVLFLDRQLVHRKMYSKTTSKIVENTLISYLDKHIAALKKGERFELFSASTGINYCNLVHYISAPEEKYYSRRLSMRISQIINNNLSQMYYQITQHYCGYVSKNQQKKLITWANKLIQMNFSFDLFKMLVQCDARISKAAKTQLKVYLKQRIDAAKNKNNNGVVVYPTKQPYEELDQVGYWCLLNVLKAKDFQEFLGNSEAFDFYCEYAKFDFSRFDVSWLLNLYPHTLEQIAKNAKVKERVRVAIATTLDGEAIAPSDSQRLQSILVKHFC